MLYKLYPYSSSVCLAGRHVEFLFPDEGLNLSYLQWKGGTLTTGPPAKSSDARSLVVPAAPLGTQMNTGLLGLSLAVPLLSLLSCPLSGPTL